MTQQIGTCWNDATSVIEVVSLNEDATCNLVETFSDPTVQSVVHSNKSDAAVAALVAGKNPGRT